MFSNVQRLTRVAMFATLCAAGPAFAGIATQPNVTLSANRINLVGCTPREYGFVEDSLARGAMLTVRVTDLTGTPIPGASVVLDFSACRADVTINSWQLHHGEMVDCPTYTVEGHTNTGGIASFVVIGCAEHRTDHLPGCAEVYVDSFLAGSLNVGTYDQTCSAGMTLADISWFFADVNSETFHDRTDVSGDGFLSLADIAYAWSVFLGGLSTHTGLLLCP